MKLNLCINTYNEEQWLPIMLKSVIEQVDKVIICDSGSTDYTKRKAMDICSKYNKPLKWINFERTNTPKDDGMQRNAYLRYLKKHHLWEWALVLDADEITGDEIKWKDIIKQVPENISCLNLKFQHFIGDLGHIDTTLPEHWTLRRLFKVKPDIEYPETEHNILTGFKPEECANLPKPTVWHMAHARHAYYWKGKYEVMRDKSNIHTPEQQQWWYYNHLFGTYPRKAIRQGDLPKALQEEFLISYKCEETNTKICIGTVPGNEERLMQTIHQVVTITNDEYELHINKNNYKGFAKAYNQIINNPGVEGVILLNDDAMPIKMNWIKELKELAGKESIAACVSCKREDEDFGEYAAFYCVYIPSEIIKDLGTLDERFEVGECEDVDYCKRAKDKGYKIKFTKQPLCQHETNYTMKKLSVSKNDKRKDNRKKLRDKWK